MWYLDQRIEKRLPTAVTRGTPSIGYVSAKQLYRTGKLFAVGRTEMWHTAQSLTYYSLRGARGRDAAKQIHNTLHIFFRSSSGYFNTKINIFPSYGGGG